MALALAAWPLTLPDYTLFRFTLALIWSIAVLGMVILVGVSGQFSIGHSAFYGVGGYSAALLAHHLGASVYWGLPLSIAACFALGYLLGRVAGRFDIWLQGMVTMALAFAFPQLLKWPPLEHLTGGVQGHNLDLVGAPAATGLSADQWWYLLSAAVLAAGIALAHNMLRGRTGRALTAVRDQDLAAAASGIDVPHYRALAFAISAAYVGVAGWLAAMQLNYVAPGSYTFWLSLQFLIGLVVGGTNVLGGALVGGLFLQFAPDLAAELGQRASLVLYGVLFVLVAVAMPEGIAGAAGRIWRRLTG